MNTWTIAVHTTFIVFVVFASGCATSQFMKSGDYTAKPREPDCDFAV